VQTILLLGLFLHEKQIDKNKNNIGGFTMRAGYDFSKSIKNPHAKYLKRQVTLRLGTDVIDYFKGLTIETGVPYQNLINLYLKECVHSRKKLRLNWAS
jgi:uncharacterized protein (DUF4415 family)